MKLVGVFRIAMPDEGTECVEVWQAGAQRFITKWENESDEEAVELSAPTEWLALLEAKTHLLDAVFQTIADLEPSERTAVWEHVIDLANQDGRLFNASN